MNALPIRIGLLGCGNVGAPLVELIARQRDDIAARLGLDLDVVRIAVRSTVKDRGSVVPTRLLTTDAMAVVTADDVDVVVEVIGGIEPARELILEALKSGKPVVTANKELLANHGSELFAASDLAQRDLQFEAAVAGGIPIIRPLRVSLAGEPINRVLGIVNGTTNYILTRMAADGADFDEALAEAQALGYAEPDPTADVDGFDALYKIAILGRLAFRTEVPIDAVYREGIRSIKAKDFRYARDLGYTIKLLAVARRERDGLLARVHPALVPTGVPMAGVNGVLNAVEVEGDLVGRLWFQGRGAGPQPTASAIIGDLIRIAREVKAGGAPTPARPVEDGLPLLRMEEHVCQYYMRLECQDRAGVLAKIAGVLGDLNISIASVIQMDVDLQRRVADLVIMTHPSREANIQTAVTRIRGLDVVVSLENLLRVESYDSVG